jgi:hypothetical protein
MSTNYVAQGWKSLMINGSHLSGKDHRAHGHREVVIAVNNRSELTTYQNLTSKEERFTPADGQLKR